MERIKQLIGSARYKMALDTDVNLKLNLHGNLQPIKSNLNNFLFIKIFVFLKCSRKYHTLTSKYKNYN